MGLIAAFARGWSSAVPGAAPGSRDGQVQALLFELAAWRPWLDEAQALLDGAEAARVQRRHRASDRDDLALAYALHRLALARALGCEPAAVALGRDGLGRPCLADEALQTSLSHADGVVGVALAPGGRLGIDVEPVARIADMAAIADHVCAPSEARDMGALGDARARELLALWVRKEALLKAAGIGLAREMPTFIAPDGARVALPLAEGGDDDECVVVRMLDAGPGYVAALACSDGAAAQAAWLRPGIPA